MGVIDVLLEDKKAQNGEDANESETSTTTGGERQTKIAQNDGF